ncbi:hypothetical protein KM043_002266 [Ampulex compressa]|nr:hypothetical protein KM043_002266 [Ampulex compressa]
MEHSSECWMRTTEQQGNRRTAEYYAVGEHKGDEEDVEEGGRILRRTDQTRVRTLPWIQLRVRMRVLATLREPRREAKRTCTEEEKLQKERVARAEG